MWERGKITREQQGKERPGMGLDERETARRG